MAYITLEHARKHLNLDECFCEDDGYIAQLIEVARAVVEKAICHKLSDLEGEDGNIPSPLFHAILLMVGNFYSNREPVVVGATPAEMPVSYQYLVDLYRDYAG
ncbi:MAG: head-tail connector protein [Prevotella sp.]|jgi:hypothetical protein|nr:head-tail connector protein [Prevotella sp.]